MDTAFLKSIGRVVPSSKDEIIITEDESGDIMYIVLKGKFGVYVNSCVDYPVLVAEIEKNSFFGEMSVIDGWPRSATVVSHEDGAVLAIGKENFELLLEKCPDIADSILSTLQKRMESTIQKVRKCGKYVPPPPKLIDTENVKIKMDIMVSIAKYIRQINTLLYEQPVSQTGIITLLPEGYTLYNIEDKNDNTDKLQARRVICPYCHKSITVYVPFISKLETISNELDGRTIYKDFNILLYSNVVCANCNFADSFKEFCKYRPAAEKPLHNGNQFKNAEHFTGFSDTQKHTFDEAILSCYLNIRCLERTGTDLVHMAKAWLRLYWLYSDLGERHFLMGAAREARDLYEKYLSRNMGEMPIQDEIRLNAILGELSAALNENEKAVKYFEANSSIGRYAPVTAQDLVQESLRRRTELKKG